MLGYINYILNISWVTTLYTRYMLGYNTIYYIYVGLQNYILNISWFTTLYTRHMLGYNTINFMGCLLVLMLYNHYMLLIACYNNITVSKISMCLPVNITFSHVIHYVDLIYRLYKSYQNADVSISKSCRLFPLFDFSKHMYFAFAYSCLIQIFVQEILILFVKFHFIIYVKYTLIYYSEFEYLTTSYHITKPLFPVLRSYTHKKSSPEQLKLVHGNATG